MRGKLFNIKNLLLAIFIVGSIFYAPHANGQAATMTANITTVCANSASPIIKFTYTLNIGWTKQSITISYHFVHYCSPIFQFYYLGAE